MYSLYISLLVYAFLACAFVHVHTCTGMILSSMIIIIIFLYCSSTPESQILAELLEHEGKHAARGPAQQRGGESEESSSESSSEEEGMEGESQMTAGPSWQV